ncbi:MAG: aspartate ammonia-lyase [Firmicutes bacterium]|nr:aspartate ammonia-lyase [Bacillota bacterium]
MGRTEEDLIGCKEIADEVYYGIQTVRAVENFPITGQRIHSSLIRALALVKKAAALANMECGYLNARIGKAIVRAAEEIIAGQWHDQFVVDPIQGGAGTSINMNANEVIANRAIEILGGKKGEYLILHPNTHVNMAQSTNDVFPTAVRIAAITLLKGAVRDVEELADALRRKEKEFDQVVKMGRTHLQRCFPIRLGQEFGAYARVVARDARRLARTEESLLVVNMGATAVGTGLNADPAYIKVVVARLRDLAGFDLRAAESLVDATQNVDPLVEVSSTLKTAAVNLTKMANDLRLMASGPRAGLGEISLPPMQPGSSIMPGKVNPVIAEVVNQAAFQIMGNDLTVTLAAQAGQLELNVMEPVLVHNLLQSLDILRNVTVVFKHRCIDGIRANVERCRELLDRSIGVVTAINPHVGYEVASQIAKEALATGRSVRSIVLERGLLTPEELEVILSPLEMTEPGIAGASLLRRS